MSMQARGYYDARAADLGIEPVPGVLGGAPVSLFTGGDLASLSEATYRAQQALTSVEPFVLQGIPGVYEALGEPLPFREWQRMQALPPNPRTATAAVFLGKHMVPFMVGAMLDGATQLWLEAVSRDQVPASALRRAVASTALRYPESTYQATQAYFVAQALSEASVCLHARLVVAQGTHNHRHFSAAEYLTPQYLGARLLGPEVEMMVAATTVYEPPVQGAP